MSLDLGLRGQAQEIEQISASLSRPRRGRGGDDPPQALQLPAGQGAVSEPGTWGRGGPSRGRRSPGAEQGREFAVDGEISLAGKSCVDPDPSGTLVGTPAPTAGTEGGL